MNLTSKGQNQNLTIHGPTASLTSVCTRMLSLLLLLSLCLSASPVVAQTAGSFAYQLKDDGTAIVTGYTRRAGEVNIGWNLDGHMVTEIGEGAFMGNLTVTSVTLPVGVKVIRESAFEGCANLREVHLPSMLETIEDRVFAGCDSLKTLFLPDSVSELGDECFEEWTVLSGNPGSLAETYSAWAGRAYQEAVTVTPTPRPVSADYLYEVRSGGIYITSYIGRDYEVHVPAEIDGLPVRTIGLNAFSSRGVDRVFLPEGLTALDKNAFRGCLGLTEVWLPNTLKTIGDHAFFLCENLAEIVIPEGVTQVGERAFQGCKLLRRATLPASVTKWTNFTFYDCHRTLTICAPRGSAAQKLADRQGYAFVATDE